MEYDKTLVPQNYDAGRSLGAASRQTLAGFLNNHIEPANVGHVVDLGCGTGRFCGFLADHFDANVTGIDPSAKMLDQARGKYRADRFLFRKGPAEALPLEDASTDFNFMSMIDHHLNDPGAAARECHRILRSGGHVVIRNTVRDETASYPYLDIFSGIRAIIEASLHSRQEQDTRHTKAGFHLVARQTNWHEMAPDWQAFADKLAMRADSFVARLDDVVFEQGLGRARTRAQSGSSETPVGLNVDMVLYRRGSMD